MRPIVHCWLIPSSRCAQLAWKDSDRQKKLQKVSDFEKAAYQHGMNSPKAAMSLTTPEAVSISQMSLSEKSSVEKIVYQQLCMFLLMKKRAAAEHGAYLWHSNLAETFLSGRRKTSSTSVDFYPNYSLYLPEIFNKWKLNIFTSDFELNTQYFEWSYMWSRF